LSPEALKRIEDGVELLLRLSASICAVSSPPAERTIGKRGGGSLAAPDRFDEVGLLSGRHRCRAAEPPCHFRAAGPRLERRPAEFQEAAAVARRRYWRAAELCGRRRGAGARQPRSCAMRTISAAGLRLPRMHFCTDRALLDQDLSDSSGI